MSLFFPQLCGVGLASRQEKLSEGKTFAPSLVTQHPRVKGVSHCTASITISLEKRVLFLDKGRGEEWRSRLQWLSAYPVMHMSLTGV